ncbi:MULTISPECIES: hypothetical protein [Polaribacter]|uniref:hypothetical protein n=1 Tax=Polaribacter TaxID=52959 RepID=UPI002090F613|nr:MULTISPECIES: hypothetical protein [Polaribacter]MDO6741821.1 hypothetical protein [Polaribacter sp. 1_MG-2023]
MQEKSNKKIVVSSLNFFKLKVKKGLFSFLFILASVFFLSCKPAVKDSSNRFKEGVFEIPAGKDFVKETIIRKDSIQISKYGDQIDTLSIKWKNNFFYTLKYINPKNSLQEDPMFIQINKFRENSYDFTVKIGFSKFKKTGTVIKVK